MAACNICEEWYHVECMRFSYSFVHTVPSFVFCSCFVNLFRFFICIRQHVCELINYEIKDITFICKEFSKLNVLAQKLFIFTSIPVERNVKSVHCTFTKYFNQSRNNKSTPQLLHQRTYSDIVRILCSLSYFLLDLASHDTEIIRELQFAEKHMSNKMEMTYSFEIKDRSSSSDGEPVLPKILRKTMQKDYKKWRMSAFFYCLCQSMCLTIHE